MWLGLGQVSPNQFLRLRIFTPFQLTRRGWKVIRAGFWDGPLTLGKPSLGLQKKDKPSVGFQKDKPSVGFQKDKPSAGLSLRTPVQDLGAVAWNDRVKSKTQWWVYNFKTQE